MKKMIKKIAKIKLTVFLFAIMTNYAFSNNNDAEQIYDKLYGKIYDIISTENQNKIEKKKLIKKNIESYLATLQIGRTLLGQNWKKLDKQQKIAYLKKFKYWAVNNLTGLLLNADIEKKLKKIRIKEKGKRTIIRSKITNEKQDINIDWYFLKTKKGTKLFDIAINNLSLVATQKETFSSIHEKEGFQGIMNFLEKKYIHEPNNQNSNNHVKDNKQNN